MLSENPSITPEFVETHIDKYWDWDMLIDNVFNSIRVY